MNQPLAGLRVLCVVTLGAVIGFFVMRFVLRQSEPATAKIPDMSVPFDQRSWLAQRTSPNSTKPYREQMVSDLKQRIVGISLMRLLMKLGPPDSVVDVAKLKEWQRKDLAVNGPCILIYNLLPDAYHDVYISITEKGAVKDVFVTNWGSRMQPSH